MANKLLPTASPEEVGIPCRAIAAFLDKIAACDFSLHSFLLVRHGKLAAEAYWKPYDRDTKHLMYSVTKSFVATAIGFLADEGKLSLDDCICDYFPEYEPEGGFHPYFRMMTIRHLLTMSTVHEKTAWKTTGSKDWVGSFFIVPPSHIPGTIFTYDTSATHTLAALIKKLSGENLLEFLRPRLLDPLGFSDDAFCWVDAAGISNGGGGLNCRPYDLAKFGLTYLNGGVFEGKQVIPAWYAKEAVAKHVDNTATGMRVEGQQGYGYFFWRARHGGFLCYGMGGQFVLGLPEKDLVLVTTGNTLRFVNDHQRILDIFWETIYPELVDGNLPADPDGDAALQARYATLALPLAPGAASSPLQKEVSGRSYRLNDGNGLGISQVSLSFEGDAGVYRFTTAEGSYELPFALGRQLDGVFPTTGHSCITSAGWLNDQTLLIYSHLLDDCVATAAIKLVFDAGAPGTITVYAREQAEWGLKYMNGYASGAAEQ